MLFHTTFTKRIMKPRILTLLQYRSHILVMASNNMCIFLNHLTAFVWHYFQCHIFCLLIIQVIIHSGTGVTGNQ